MKILHVEDDRDIQEIARLALEVVGGFTVLQCSSGKAAIAAAPAFAPDILLLDVMMPGLSGLETLEQLRRMDAFRDTPAIFMTAAAHPDEVRSFMDTGALAVVTKPFDPLTLAAEIRTLAAQAPTTGHGPERQVHSAAG